MRNLFPSTLDSAPDSAPTVTKVTTVSTHDFVVDPPDVTSPAKQQNAGRLRTIKASEKATKASFYSRVQTRVTLSPIS